MESEEKNKEILTEINRPLMLIDQYIGKMKYLLQKTEYSDNKIDIRDEEPVELTFLPLSITSYDFKHLIRVFSEFFRDNENPSMFVITLDENGNVYKSWVEIWTEQNLIAEIKEINPDLIKKILTKPIKTSTYEQLFKRIKDLIYQEENILIGNLRILKYPFIERLFSIHKQFNHSKTALTETLVILGRYLDIYLDSIDESSVIIFPSSRLPSFLLKFREYYQIPSYYEIFWMFFSQMPERKLSLTLYDENFESSFLISFKNTSNQILPIEINEKLRDIEDQVERHRRLIFLIIKDLKIRNNYLINLKNLKSLIEEIITSEIPFQLNRLYVIFSKLLFFYKDIGFSWEHLPKLLIYNGIFRFFMYSRGYRYYTFKLSYWAIPEIIKRIFLTEFGQSSRIALIIATNDKIITDSRIRTPKHIHRFSGIILDLSRNIITNCKEINENEELIGNKLKEIGYKGRLSSLRLSDLKEFKELLGNMIEDLSHIIIVDAIFIKEFEKTFLFKFHTHGIGVKRIANVLKLIYNKDHIRIYPQPPIWSYLSGLKPKKLLSEIGPIITDLHEF